MRIHHIIGLMASAACLPATPSLAQPAGSHPAPTVTSSPGGPTMPHHADWNRTVEGRWWAGHEAPGGWSAYRTPVNGFILPGYWLQPGYHIAEPERYGLPQPPPGYGWSRYYDDAVLTDTYGSVHDSRIGYDWDRPGGYSDADYRYDAAPEEMRRDDAGRAVAGAAIGGVAGGLIGSAVAGPGNRTGGAILGAGLGAITGAVVADASAGPRGDMAYAPARGSLSAAEQKLLREEARQRRKLDTLARKAGYADYDAFLLARAAYDERHAPAPLHRAPHWAMTGGPEYTVSRQGGVASPSTPRVHTRQLPGYYADGYYYPGATITTITIDPGGSPP
ncbi:hypothetical protein SLG_32500 [Sphingobium sp. SYK-6]|uniref:RcnB family protein n=1 Tax=Sphingobium sp. (strain NBRC 103272 / SYK-6) TaxID=627192 RepID=UPI000227774B|nr:RcnB family protein [Sphingobium sp. SYK-6]BAK67925.1 hypothetical protein SLG_32500 [Sphingobium sp. SYK-6]